MRCPKCHYLSFEPEPRCRNCGHALDLTGPLDVALPGLVADEPVTAVTPVETPAPTPRPAAEPLQPPRVVDHAKTPAALFRERPRIKPDPPAGPFDDGRGERMVPSPPVVHVEAPPSSSESDTLRRVEVSRPVAPPTTELPLFVKGVPDAAEIAPELDEPLVKVPSTPRPPLAVRMRTPDPAPAPVAPTRTPQTLEAFDRDLLDDLRRFDRLELPRAEEKRGPVEDAGESDETPASLRLLAAGIDGAVIGSIQIAVLWMTLRWCDLTISQIGVLPLLPIVTFFAIITVGYWLLFTAAGGQTLGKMAAHLRVVDAAEEDPQMVTISQAFWRSCASVLTIATLGLGWLPGLVGTRRALHDWLAGTRVIRA